MNANINRQQAWDLLTQYNKDNFHKRHALTMEGVMKWYAMDQKSGDDEFWGIAGLLHDIDFEQFPNLHCLKAPELLAAGGCSRKVIEDGAAMLGWDLDTLIEKTILAMRSCEAEVMEQISIK